jgi:hypothetical protein
MSIHIARLCSTVPGEICKYLKKKHQSTNKVTRCSGDCKGRGSRRHRHARVAMQQLWTHLSCKAAMGEGATCLKEHTTGGARSAIAPAWFCEEFVLSRSLALRNTVLGKSTRVGADYEEVMIN